MLANKRPENVTLPFCWTVVDFDWFKKWKHLFCLYSYMKMLDILSCAGTAQRVWGVGSEERGMALWDIFFTVEYGGGVVFVNLKSRKIFHIGCHFPQWAFMKRFIPRSLGFFDVLFNAGMCFLTADLIRFAGVFCARKYVHNAWSWVSIPNPCVYPSLSFT